MRLFKTHTPNSSSPTHIAFSILEGGGQNLGGNAKLFSTVKVPCFITKVLVRIRFFFSLRIYCCFSKIIFFFNFFYWGFFSFLKKFTVHF